jgi:hypothetical protein
VKTAFKPTRTEEFENAYLRGVWDRLIPTDQLGWHFAEVHTPVYRFANRNFKRFHLLVFAALKTKNYFYLSCYQL